LNFYINFFSDYSTFWEKIVKKEYPKSWDALQNTLGSLRLVKRLSSIDLSRFETQIIDLEKTYPYRLFASMGIIAEWIECSICGQDIDSLECPHRAGELYMGKLAQGIVRDIKKLDHVALTENPEDKRCVITPDGREYEFPTLDWLERNLRSCSFAVSQLSHVELSQRRVLNAEYVRGGRNELCFCGSGKKFKCCCIDKQYAFTDHAEFIIAAPVS
jgi:hypothetical protein